MSSPSHRVVPRAAAALGTLGFAVWALAFGVGSAGCSDRPPPVPLRDGGPRPDASFVDGGPHDASLRRRDGAVPALPPADVEIVLPYGGPVETLRIEIQASPALLDVVFSVDTTGSFGGEIDVLQGDLAERIVPAIAAQVPDVAIAVAHFEDFPAAPFGLASDRPFELVTPMTTDLARIGAAVASLEARMGGGDEPESGAEALYQVATGEGYRHEGREIVADWSGPAASGGGLAGGVGFREGSLRAVVHVTDAPTHSASDYAPVFPGAHSLSQAISAMQALDARVLGIASGSGARGYLETAALATGGFITPIAGGCPTGRGGASLPPVSGRCPLVFDIDANGAGLSDAIVDAITNLVGTVSYAEAWGEADDPLRFVRAIAAFDATTSAGVTPPGRADLRPVDGTDDTFLRVLGGTRLVFEVRLANETVLPADYDQVFRIVVRVLGDGAVLAMPTIRVIVPRGRTFPDGGPPVDAGRRDAGSPDASSIEDASVEDASSADAGE